MCEHPHHNDHRGHLTAGATGGCALTRPVLRKAKTFPSNRWTSSIFYQGQRNASNLQAAHNPAVLFQPGHVIMSGYCWLANAGNKDGPVPIT
jgi:hypothetical protein